MFEFTEIDEVVGNMLAVGATHTELDTMSQAEAEITRTWGPPAEIGYVIHANAAEALLVRARSSRR